LKTLRGENLARLGIPNLIEGLERFEFAGVEPDTATVEAPVYHYPRVVSVNASVQAGMTNRTLEDVLELAFWNTANPPFVSGLDCLRRKTDLPAT